MTSVYSSQCSEDRVCSSCGRVIPAGTFHYTVEEEPWSDFDEAETIYVSCKSCGRPEEDEGDG